MQTEQSGKIGKILFNHTHNLMKLIKSIFYSKQIIFLRSADDFSRKAMQPRWQTKVQGTERRKVDTRIPPQTEVRSALGVKGLRE